MKRLMTIVALAGLVTACSDSITQPESARLVARAPAAAQEAGQGTWLFRFDADATACNIWDTDDNLIWVNCTLRYLPASADGFGWVLKTEGKLTNSTGRAVVYGPTYYPQFWAAMQKNGLGVEPRNGLMPVCDWDFRKYPNGWVDWDLAHLACTTNWQYTISASGQGTFAGRFDKQHTYYPFAP